MSKTDKELAVELAVASIASRPRLSYNSRGGHESVTKPYTVDEVQKMTKMYYDMLNDIDNFIPNQKNKSKV